MKAELVCERKKFTFKEEGNKRSAEIEFIKIPIGIWALKECMFRTVSNPYDLEDWNFLSHLSCEIIALEKVLNEVRDEK